MKLFLLAFIVGICVVFSVPKSFSVDVIKQEAKEKLEKKANQGDAKAQLQSAIMNERDISHSQEIKIDNLLKAKTYYKGRDKA